MNRIIFFIVLFIFSSIVSSGAAEYGVAINSTPVLNTADFKAVFGGADGNSLKTDRCGQLRELEFIALPGSLFTILKKERSGTADIYQVATDEYAAPPGVRLYVDGRFLKLVRSASARQRPPLPPREAIVAALKASSGSPYVWGGNLPDGVPELLYALGRDADKSRRILAGLDCSGLLYHATGGLTPRNTSQLIGFGQGVDIAGKKSSEISSMLTPLDLIAWNGHVIIVLDQQTTIESRLECGKPGHGGVVITPLPQRIAEIMRTRRPANAWQGDKKHPDLFVVRRWYSPQGIRAD